MSIINEIKRSFQVGGIITRLIYVNVGMFVVVKLLAVFISIAGGDGDGLIMNTLSMPASLQSLLKRPWTVLTYQFLHLGFLHLIFNVLWLYWFGRLFLSHFSSRQALSVYIWGGLWGAALYLVSAYSLPFFKERLLHTEMLGASASIMALVIAAATAMPNAEIHLILIGKIKMKYLAIATVLIDLLLVDSSNSGGHLAHLGGALGGYLFASSYLKSNRDLTSGLARFIDFFATYFFKRKPHMKVRRTKAHAADKRADMDYNWKKKEQEDDINKILEKIKQSGYKSLSKSEKQRLFDAGKS